MKNLFATASTLLLALTLSCTNQDELALKGLSNEAIFTKVDEQPAFEGGMPAFYEYINNNLQFPKDSKLAEVKGRVYVQFIITKDGSIEEPIIIKGLEETFDKAALELVKNSPKWIPGSQKGVPVNVKMVLPISFGTSPAPNPVTLEIEYLEGNSLEKVDKMPEYKGGIPTFYTYVLANLKYPQQARREGVEGKVMVQFVVSKNGTVKDAIILKGIGASCDNAALDIINNSKGWTAGEYQNKPVDVQMVLPITFKLD